jgi:signal transduction histidine kinase
MAQRDERPGAGGATPVAARVACGAVAVVVVAIAAWIVWLRIDNGGNEPEGANWWLVTLLLGGLAYGVVGAALLFAELRRHRTVGAVFLVIAAGAVLTAASIQYLGHERGDAGAADGGWLGDASRWSKPLTLGLIAAVVPWLVRPGTWRPARPAAAGTAAVVAITAMTAAFDWPDWLDAIATWTVAVSATAAVGALLAAWWPVRKGTDDPLPAWLAAGAIAAWLGVVPGRVAPEGWALGDSDVLPAILVAATVPLLVGGAIVAAIRDRSSSVVGLSRRTLEWAVLASGIVLVYTGVVVGLGTLLGGSGPTWLLVAVTGALAVALEPIRQRVRWLVDRLVFGARDDPLAVVQRIVDQLGADAGDHLLQDLVVHLQDELRLDAVAIDLRVAHGWQRAAALGPPTTHQRVVPLTHRGEVAGRLVLGWEDQPSLRERDERILAEIAGPLSLAVGWVQLADDLRRSSVAVVSAREEERRRLRRDLHDGLGPSLTGVSLGLRTAIRQLGRIDDRSAVAPAHTLLERVADEVDAVVAELKRIVRDLRPTALDQLGLVEAVAEFTRGFGDAVEIHLALPTEPVELPAAVEVATYRIVTEAVTNVVRHARAARCWLTITTGPTVVIDVVDDGVGITAGERHGVGITAMHERVAELGGSMRLVPNRPCGTRVHVLLPAALP